MSGMTPARLAVNARGESVARDDVLRSVVGDPGLPLRVLPHQNLERQVQTRRRHGLHQRRARFRVAENQHAFRSHIEPHPGRVGREIESGKDGDVVLLELALEALDRLGHRVIPRRSARNRDPDSGVGRHGILRQGKQCPLDYGASGGLTQPPGESCLSFRPIADSAPSGHLIKPVAHQSCGHQAEQPLPVGLLLQSSERTGNTAGVSRVAAPCGVDQISADQDRTKRPAQRVRNVRAHRWRTEPRAAQVDTLVLVARHRPVKLPESEDHDADAAMSAYGIAADRVHAIAPRRPVHLGLLLIVRAGEPE